ncbi:19551_t:CDS:1 [Funneliformis geosporum]|uniref:10547_t:CDS:1 n=1 Tax=Funneliformis geosporum TaxID=1117311 RepID=A0A9W4SMH4_9GLOM|nr:19551_t:CDS:1 [Funneliformis geosporum]CAI2174798.1 10547_t:CDS:1 [Funneliformis geosporum]
MTSFKVSYQSTVRRFSIPDTVTWSDLESKLRLLFSLPSTLKFSLSYKDEDGDIITLSTNLELQEFLSSQSPQSTLKFSLNPEKSKNFFADTFSSNASENDFVPVEKEKYFLDDALKHVTVMDFVNDESSTPSVSKGKKKESPAEPSASAFNEHQQEENKQPSPNNDEEQRAPFIELAEQFQKLHDQFNDVFLKNPQLVEQANTIMDNILQNVPVDFNQWAQWLNTFRSEGDLPNQGSETNNNSREGGQQRANDFGQFGQFSNFFSSPHELLSNPWIQRVFQDVSANGFGNFSRSTGFNGPWNSNGGCQRRQEDLSQEALKEKINSLHSMGFWEDDVKNEELLKRYNGNIERVVEILIRQNAERLDYEALYPAGNVGGQ